MVDKNRFFFSREFVKRVSVVVLCAFLFTSCNTIIVNASVVSIPEEQFSASFFERNNPSASNNLGVESFIIPESLGQVKDRYVGSGPKTIIHIQDAHCNYAAQQKISSIIKYLNREFDIDIVNLEGGAGVYDLSIFKYIRNINNREKISDYLLTEGVVNGSEYFTINNPEKIQLWGVENSKLYMENVIVYRDSLKYKEEVDIYLDNIENSLNKLKQYIYSKELLEFSKKYDEYIGGEFIFKEYVSYLINLTNNYMLSFEEFPNISIFRQTIIEESKIDFKKADKERYQLVDDLKNKLSKKEFNEVALKTISFHQNNISQNNFYEFLISTARVVNVNIDKFLNFQNYVNYLSIYKSIDKSRMSKEIEVMESDIKEYLFLNDSQRELDLLIKNFMIIKKLFNFMLTEKDYQYYQDNIKDFEMGKFISFINKKSIQYDVEVGLDNDVISLDLYRDKISRFFEYSFQRDEIFVKNLKFPQKGKKVSIIVTGGFHTKNFCEQLKKENISYVSIMPSFKSNNKYKNPYFELLAGEMNSFSQQINAAISYMQIASLWNSLGTEVSKQESELIRLSIVAWDLLMGKTDKFAFEISLKGKAGWVVLEGNGTEGPPKFYFSKSKPIGITELDSLNGVVATEVAHILWAMGEIVVDRQMPKDEFGYEDNSVDKLVDDLQTELLILGLKSDGYFIKKLMQLKGSHKVDGIDKEVKILRFVKGVSFDGHAGGFGIRISDIYRDTAIDNRSKAKQILLHELVASIYEGGIGVNGDNLNAHELAEDIETAYVSGNVESLLLLLGSAKALGFDNIDKGYKTLWEMTREERRSLVSRDYISSKRFKGIFQIALLLGGIVMPSSQIQAEIVYETDKRDNITVDSESMLPANKAKRMLSEAIVASDEVKTSRDRKSLGIVLHKLYNSISDAKSIIGKDDPLYTQAAKSFTDIKAHYDSLHYSNTTPASKYIKSESISTVVSLFENSGKPLFAAAAEKVLREIQANVKGLDIIGERDLIRLLQEEFDFTFHLEVDTTTGIIYCEKAAFKAFNILATRAAENDIKAQKALMLLTEHLVFVIAHELLHYSLRGTHKAKFSNFPLEFNKIKEILLIEGSVDRELLIEVTIELLLRDYLKKFEEVGLKDVDIEEGFYVSAEKILSHLRASEIVVDEFLAGQFLLTGKDKFYEDTRIMQGEYNKRRIELLNSFFGESNKDKWLVDIPISPIYYNSKSEREMIIEAINMYNTKNKTFSTPASSQMKPLGLRDSMDEDFELNLLGRHVEFESLAAASDIENVYGLQARVVISDLFKTGAYHFISDKYGLVIVVDLKNKAIHEEGKFHEAREVYWKNKGFNDHEAHVIASAEQVQYFSKENKLTTYHLLQLKNMTKEQREAIQKENEKRRRWHYTVLKRANNIYSAGIDINLIKDYEKTLRLFSAGLETQRWIDRDIGKKNREILIDGYMVNQSVISRSIDMKRETVRQPEEQDILSVVVVNDEDRLKYLKGTGRVYMEKVNAMAERMVSRKRNSRVMYVKTIEEGRSKMSGRGRMWNNTFFFIEDRVAKKEQDVFNDLKTQAFVWNLNIPDESLFNVTPLGLLMFSLKFNDLLRRIEENSFSLDIEPLSEILLLNIGEDVTPDNVEQVIENILNPIIDNFSKFKDPQKLLKEYSGYFIWNLPKIKPQNWSEVMNYIKALESVYSAA